MAPVPDEAGPSRKPRCPPLRVQAAHRRAAHQRSAKAERNIAPAARGGVWGRRQRWVADPLAGSVYLHVSCEAAVLCDHGKGSRDRTFYVDLPAPGRKLPV